MIRLFSKFQVAATAVILAATIPVSRGQTSAPPPKGDVLFSRGSDAPVSAAAVPEPLPLGQNDPLAVTDEERSALTFTAYDLDTHLTPATSSVAMRARITLRNDGPTALNRIVLQVSSTLRWQSVSLAGVALPLAARLVATDADHTGSMDEAVVTLPHALAPGGTADLVTLYSGAIVLSAQRLERTGAPAAQAQAADWDKIATEGTFLRGFGYVLWYPVSAPPVFFRDGDRLFRSVGAMRRREEPARVRLRLAIEYQGEPPDAAFFSGRRELLRPISDNPSAPTAEAPGIATADFDAETLGFRVLDLFVTPRPALQVGTVSNRDLISISTENESAVATCSSVAAQVEPLLTTWFGPHPRSPLYVIDHPGQPFEDETLLIRPISGKDSSGLAESLAHSLTHAWIRSRYPWIDEGLAEFARLLWLEETRGRGSVLSLLQQDGRALAEAEGGAGNDSAGPASSSSSSTQSSSGRSSSTQSSGASGKGGPSLVDADREVFYRTKAAAVWWMLRGIMGDQALQQTLQAYRSDAAADDNPQGLEHTLENASHKDLRWFFNDWVYQDRGLPRLSIVAVTPSQLNGRTGLPDGWLIAVEVRNDGDAAAEVPVIVRSGLAQQAGRLRIAPHSSSSTRIVFAGTPEEVLVNDGGVPESGPSVHSRELTLRALRLAPNGPTGYSNGGLRQ